MTLHWIPITLSVYNHSVDDFAEVFKIIRSQLEIFDSIAGRGP